jgi:hypothetical protein
MFSDYYHRLLALAKGFALEILSGFGSQESRESRESE